MWQYPERYRPVYIATMNLGDFFASIETAIVSKPIPAVHSVAETMSDRYGHEISVRIIESMPNSESRTTPMRGELEILVYKQTSSDLVRRGLAELPFGRSIYSSVPARS